MFKYLMNILVNKMRFDTRSCYNWAFSDVKENKKKYWILTQNLPVFSTYKNITMQIVSLSLEPIVNRQPNILGRNIQRQKIMPNTIIS